MRTFSTQAGRTEGRRLQLSVSLVVSGALIALGYLGASSPSNAGAAESFPGQGFLPDDRAWELVSPPDKNGGEIISHPGMTRAVDDCSSECSVAFDSLTAFGDAIGMSGGHTQYVARRLGEPGTSGWSTHGINPPQERVPDVLFTGTIFRTGYMNAFSSDGSRGVIRTYAPVATLDDPHPNVENMVNLYYRDDLTTPGSGTYRLLTDAPVTFPNNNNRPLPLGANVGDGSHAPFDTITFESRAQLGDAPPGTQMKMFAHTNGATHVVNQVPSSSDAACGDAGAACTTTSSSASPKVPFKNNTIAGIAKNHVQSQRAISDDGTRIYFRAPASNLGEPTSASRLYMRDDQGTADPSDDITARIQHSEKTTPESAQSALFWYGSADGSKAFLTTPEGLVDGDSNGSADLYLYTHSADPVGDTNLTRISVDSEGADDANVTDVIGATPAADQVYFVSSGALVSGQPPLTSGVGLYHWSDTDGLEFIGEIRNPADAGNLDINSIRGTHYEFVQGMLTSRVASNGDLLFSASDSSGFVDVGGFEGYDHGDECDTLQGATGACRELFVYSPDDDSLVCASCSPSGAPAESDAMVASSAGLSGVAIGEQRLQQALSEDGRYVFFTTSDTLVPEDKNGPCELNERSIGRCQDVYRFDTTTNQVRLLSSGQSTDASFFLDATDDGSVAFISTREQLSEWDQDGAYDLYAAVAGGGFPEPEPDEVPCLTNEECKGSTPELPGDDELGTDDFEGGGNVSSDPPDCSSQQQSLADAKQSKRKAGRKAKQLKRKAKQATGKKRSKRLRRRAKRIKRKARAGVREARTDLRQCSRGDS